MIPSQADIFARAVFRAALADDNVARNNSLTAGFFNPKRLLSESRPFLVLPPAFL